MFFKSLKVVVLLCSALMLLSARPVDGFAQTSPDSLMLQQPADLFVVPVMLSNRQLFVNYVFWQDVPDTTGTYIHPPDTTGWRSVYTKTVQESLSVPVAGGVHVGSVDRTLGFRALESGRVGQGAQLRIRYDIVGEERFNRTVNIGAGYTPGTPIPCILSTLEGETLDLGLTIAFEPGLVDSNGVFKVGLEDFEGFHLWRGLQSDGSDLTVIGELSKQEAFEGSPIDLLYFSEILPALRATGVYTFPFPVPGIGTTLDITSIHPNGRLGPNECAWFDTNAFNGFTYYYTVTTFDRGYTVSSGNQGLTKFDNCLVAQGAPYPCLSELFELSANVTPQNDLNRVYAVPNPFRSGSSQFTTPNYHNFPDNKVRFVNVPSDCTLRIYTVSGDFIYQVDNTGGMGNLEWDTRNTAGEFVTSGAYIFRCKDPSGNDVYGRLIIIR